MPQATLSAARLESILGRPADPAMLEPLLFRSKSEVARWEGDDVVVEATADRIDLLCESGLAMHVAGGLGSAKGLAPLRRFSPGSPGPRVDADSSTDSLRPAVGAILLKAPEGSALDAALLSEAIRFQEILHATRGAKRRIASLGIYPWNRLVPPIRYSLEPVAELEFVPLGGGGSVSGGEFFGHHPQAVLYGDLGRAGDRCLTLRDGRGTLLSLPPILNTREGGEARPGDSVLLLESTGVRSAAVQDMLGLLSVVFVASGWAVAPVPVGSPQGEDSGESVISPRSLSLSSKRLSELSGLSWSAAETEKALAESRLGAHTSEGGWRVEVPPWRPDLQTETDVAEDLILARGVRAEDALIAPSSTRGRRRAETTFRDRAAGLLLGLGYAQLHTPVLCARSAVERLERAGAVELENPASELYAVFRPTLLVSLVAALEHNVRFGYPQRLFEVGPVVVRDSAAETGTETRYHAATIFASERAGFSDGAALADYLLSSLGARGLREPTEIAGTIPGRAAGIRLAGERVGDVGEIHPQLLTAMRVPVAAVWTELDLSALWPLLRPHEAA